MFTQYKDHLKWQQYCSKERKDQLGFHDKVNYFGDDKNTYALDRLESRQKKRLFSITPLKYTGDTRPILDKETGVMGLYAPLHQTRYGSIGGWEKEYRKHRNQPENRYRTTVTNFNISK